MSPLNSAFVSLPSFAEKLLIRFGSYGARGRFGLYPCKIIPYYYMGFAAYIWIWKMPTTEIFLAPCRLPYTIFAINKIRFFLCMFVFIIFANVTLPLRQMKGDCKNESSFSECHVIFIYDVLVSFFFWLARWRCAFLYWLQPCIASPVQRQAAACHQLLFSILSVVVCIYAYVFVFLVCIRNIINKISQLEAFRRSTEKEPYHFNIKIVHLLAFIRFESVIWFYVVLLFLLFTVFAFFFVLFGLPADILSLQMNGWILWLQCCCFFSRSFCYHRIHLEL